MEGQVNDKESQLPACTGVSVCKTYTNNADSLENKKARTLSTLRGINSALPGVKDYVTVSSGLPDNFLLFSVVDKLDLLLTLSKSITAALINDEIVSSGLSDNVEAQAAKANIDAAYKAVSELTSKLKDIAIRTVPR